MNTHKKNILIFGNPLVEKDNLILKLLPKLKQNHPTINFIHIDPTENLDSFGPDLTIIDVIVNISHPMIITDINQLNLPNVNSMHDFDLAYNLKLLINIGKIKNIKIYGLPHNMPEDKAVEWLKKTI